MWAFMKLNEATSLLPSRDVGRDYVLDPDRKYIYLDDGVINNYIAQQNCEVESIEQNFGIKHFSMGFPKGRSTVVRYKNELAEHCEVLHKLAHLYVNYFRNRSRNIELDAFFCSAN